MKFSKIFVNVVFKKKINSLKYIYNLFIYNYLISIKIKFVQIVNIIFNLHEF